MTVVNAAALVLGQTSVTNTTSLVTIVTCFDTKESTDTQGNTSADCDATSADSTMDNTVAIE